MSSSSHPIVRLLSTDPKWVVGLTSGTSLDGIDAVLVEVAGHGASASVRLVRFLNRPLPPSLQAVIAAIVEGTGSTSAAELASLNFQLGNAFADAAEAVIGREVVDLVGSHGQTLWHQPPWMKTRTDLLASTMQLGEPAVIAARVGVVTVGDFRVADMALAGEGEPLTAYPDWVMFRRPGMVRALQHLGGTANVTVVGPELHDVFAFDNGPGTIMLDALTRLATGGQEGVDRDGQWSARGAVLPALLAELLDDDYLRRPPPKSSDRERWGRRFVDQLVQRHRRAEPFDLLATAAAFVAHAIADSLQSFVLTRTEVDEVLVSGGGARNETVLGRLRELLAPLPVRTFAEAGVPPEAKEALCYALLAVEAIHAYPANLVAATGARRPAVLGKICLPPP